MQRLARAYNNKNIMTTKVYMMGEYVGEFRLSTPKKKRVRLSDMASVRRFKCYARRVVR